MSDLNEIRRLIERCSEEQKRELLKELRHSVDLHPFEKRLNTRAEIILEALERAPDLTIRGIRGIIGEATFVQEVVPSLSGWQDVTPGGNHTFDSMLKDDIGEVRLQVKLQRRLKGLPWIKSGMAIVEVQRTRTGNKDGEATRPYRFGEFDILAVCMEPSHKCWNSFLYIPARWLIARIKDKRLIQVMQPVPLVRDAVYTNDFNEAVVRLRSKNPRPLPK